MSDNDHSILLSKQHEWHLNLFCKMYSCVECSLDEDTNYVCCVGKALPRALPDTFPVDIMSIIHGYSLDEVTYSFLTNPVPQNITIQCHVIRKSKVFEFYMERTNMRAYSGVNTEYTNELRQKLLPLQRSNSLEQQMLANNLKPILIDFAETKLHSYDVSNILLLRAKKKSRIRGNKYIISNQHNPEHRLGIVKSNFLGSEYVLSESRHQLYESGLLKFSHFEDNSYSPIQIQAFLTKEPRDGIESKFKNRFATPSASSTQILPNNNNNNEETESKTTTSIDTIQWYENIRPEWDDNRGSFVLNFDHNRVLELSVKNFKLAHHEQPLKSILQFGRTNDRNKFILDFCYPLSPLQAFQICLAVVDPKLGV